MPPAATLSPPSPNMLDRRWQDLQRSRAELDLSRSETHELRKGVRELEQHIHEIEDELARYCRKTKNPFKLTLSRMLEPSAMRRERKSIEAHLKAVTAQLKKMRHAPEAAPLPVFTPSQHGKNSAAPRSFSLPDRAARHHVIISGTGRAGTTFLVELLTALGLETGYQHYSTLINPIAHAGLEWDLRHDDAPYIVKNPSLCDYLGEILEQGSVVIDHAFVPLRDLADAARSRAAVASEAASLHASGGFWEATSMDEQEIVLRQKLCNLFVTLAAQNVPTTLLAFPRLVDDPDYLYEKLAPILEGITLDNFRTVFAAVSHPELVTRS